MICCLSPEEKAMRQRDKEISKKLKEKGREREKVVNLLLLGSGESGKSTIFKQMKLLSNQSIGEEAEYVEIIIDNILESMWHLVNAMFKFHITLSNPQLMEVAGQFKEWNSEFKLTPAIAKSIKAIWQDPNMQTVYKRRSEFQLTDSAPYFFNRVEEIASPQYKPSVEDMLRARVRTRSILHITFTFEGMTFHMTDVGGQRQERKKWIDCFSNVRAVIFVVGVSEYDQKLEEDNTTNRMQESLALFGQVLKYSCFATTAFILFLNKIDLFYEKIKVKPITIAFPEYKGQPTHDESLAYIKDRFISLNTTHGRMIYVHKTCATDTNNIRKVFVSVKDIILRDNLADIGVM